MVDVRFELTTNDPWSVDDAICEGICPLGYWQEVNQSPTQTKPYNTNTNTSPITLYVNSRASSHFGQHVIYQTLKQIQENR